MQTDLQQMDRRLLLQNALTAVEKLQAKLDAVEQAQSEPIAIIGLSCRFPGGANTPEAYWELLQAGRDVVTEVPAERWNTADYTDPQFEGTGQAVNWYGGFLDQVDQFDPQFFGISPREAETMDPQQRLVLEVSWEALERAGQPPDKLKGSQTGIFIGITTNDYSQLAKLSGPAQMDVYTATGTALNAAPGRVAYTLGFHGPSMAVDTACSSSLVAIHLACQSLRTGESNLALAGGVNALLAPEAFICFSKWGMMAPDGRCKTFDAGANGFVRGEGCGIIVLKRLSDARAAGDNILALIRGSAVNQDGRSSGLTVPNGLAQQAVIRKALANAKVQPSEISYVEAHGTGTSLGDPIEIEALGVALGEGRSQEKPLTIGSVKTNIGHLESASGVAGLIKVVLSMQHQELPPHLHLQERSPQIPWPRFPVVIPTERLPWSAESGPRLAGVSSFGFSGTNAHVILEEAPAQPPVLSQVERPCHLLSLSAKNEPALKQKAVQLADHLAANPAVAISDIAYAANLGRSHFNHRLAIVADSAQEAREKLTAWATDQKQSGVIYGQVHSSGRPQIVFLFTGQGSQYAGMGRQLYETQPAFRKTLERCDEILQPYLEQSLLSILYPKEGAASPIDETIYTQPALFALEYALAMLWRSWGIEPAAVMGHSVGEYVAACVAGVFSLEDGLKLIATRGRLMQALPQGGEMAAVFATETPVAAAIASYADRVSIAAVNGPENIVISGAGPAIQAILDTLAAEGIKAQRLTVSHAFHSPLMEPMLNAFTATAATITYHAPQIRVISNVTGQASGQEIATAAYWREHVRAPVRFAAGMQTLHAQGYQWFLEIGPKPTLLSLGQRSIPSDGKLWLPSLRSGRVDWSQMLESLAALYVNGQEVDWGGFEQNYARRKLSLPTYPFQRQRYWLDVSKDTVIYPTKHIHDKSSHPLLGQRLRSPLIKETVFETEISVKSPAFLNDHRVYGTPLFPGTGYLEIALAAANQGLGSGPYSVEEVAIQEALILPEDGARMVQIALAPTEANAASFQIFSLEDTGESWKLNATGKIRSGAAVSTSISMAEVQARCVEEISAELYYQQLAELGLAYGPSFRGITQIWRREGEALGEIKLPKGFASEAAMYQLHPALLDACFQLLGAAMPRVETETQANIYVPVGLASYRVYQPGYDHVWGQVTLQLENAMPGEAFEGDVKLINATGQLVAEITGLHLRRITEEAIRRATRKHSDEWFYEIEWQHQDLEIQRPDAVVKPEPGSWLIFADRQGVAESLAQHLEGQGEICQLVRPGSGFQAEGTVYYINPNEPEDFRRLLAEVTENMPQPYRGAVHLWGLDMSAEAAVSPVAGQSLTCGSVLNLVQVLTGTNPGLNNQAKLWLVTRGAQFVASDRTPLAAIQTPLWGLARTIILEHPELNCACLDLDPVAESDPALALFQQIWTPDSENQIALRHHQCYVARLGRSTQPTTEGGPVELTISKPGLLDSLTFRPSLRQQPGPGEVEIRVQATGLNFRDVLNALGVYPGSIPFGNECVGIIVGLGEGVSNAAIGDEVIALTAGAFKTFVTVLATQVFPKPANLTFSETATIPTTFLTAYYGLYCLAKIKAGDRILIHAAAGGVGLATVQLAQRVGAEIFATAGSPEKRAYLQSIGVQHVLDSRSLDFADEIMALTGGRGVNIVLNSLANEFITKSLSILADQGYFLELGKRDDWDEAQVAALNPTWHYHRYDLAEVMQKDPTLIRSTLSQLLDDFESGVLKPLPLQTFPIQQVSEAFQYMARAKHIGKVVITQDENLLLTNQVQPFTEINAQATYLVTGGLGGLGLVVARWLVEQGAKYVVLMSRNQPKNTAWAAIREMEQAGVKVIIAQGDVSRREDVSRVLAEIEQTTPPLRGIIHAAGVLDDGLLGQQTWSRFETVMAPKIDGAWHLHTLSQHLPLDFFVLFSAGAAVLGSPGQGNYAAANAFLDGLAYYRRMQGLPALSINWGAWGEVGMAAALDRRSRERWAAQGVELIRPQEGVYILEQLLGQNRVQVAVLPMNWAKLGQLSAQYSTSPLFSRFALPQADASPIARDDFEIKLETLLAVELEERQRLLEEYLGRQAAYVLKLAPSGLDIHEPLTNLGFDSLMAVELKNRIETDLEIVIPMVQFLQGLSTAQLAMVVLDKVTSVETVPAPTPTKANGTLGDNVAAQSETMQLLASLDQLSEEQVDLLLSNLLAEEGVNE